MKVAVPVFGSRVAPNFLHCEEMIVARVDEEPITIETHRITEMTEVERVDLVDHLEPTVLVCGGIDRALADELIARGVAVISNVAGETDEILRRVARNELTQGYGITHRSKTTSAPDASTNAPGIDCAACANRVCLDGGGCDHLPSRDLSAVVMRHRDTLEVMTDIAVESETVLCRIAELVYYALGRGCEHVGLAFCTEMFSEAETVARILRRHLRVSTVCCKAGGPSNGTDAPCNPVAMACALNDAGTDLNIMLGLCIGCDIVFAELSGTPSTTLFVKDRLLANNPIGAVYSRQVLDRILAEP